MLDISQYFDISEQKDWQELARAGLKDEQNLNFPTDEGVHLGLDYSQQKKLELRTFNLNPQLIDHRDFEKKKFFDVFYEWEKSKRSWDDFITGHLPRENKLINLSLIHNSGGSIVHELEFALSMLEQLSSQGIDKVSFLVSVDSLYFCQLAKLRALRFLLESLAEKFDLPSFEIIVESSLREQTQFDLHNNMLRGTLALTAALNAGVDMIKLTEFDALSKTSSKRGFRQAENAYYILTEESFLGRVHDPAAGSSIVEGLSSEFVELAYESFKKRLHQGGLFQKLPDWCLEVKRVGDKRSERILTQEKTIVGVNSFVELEDKALEIKTLSKSRYFPVRRPTEKLERLRKDLLEQDINIVLVKLGDDKTLASRLSFAKNILEVTGKSLQVLEPSELSSLGQSIDVFVLCAADQDYLKFPLKPQGRINIIVSREVTIDGLENLYKGRDIYALLSPLCHKERT